MDIFTAVAQRREITRYKSSPIPHSFLQQIVETACLSVTGNHLPSREFIIVTNRNDLNELAGTTPFMPWLRQTPTAIVIVGNPAESKYWLQDATIAASNVWLAAVALGLGAAWGAIHHSEDDEECRRREAHVRQILNVPEQLRPVAIMGIGYASEEPKPKAPIPVSRVVHRHRYGQRLDRIDELDG